MAQNYTNQEVYISNTSSTPQIQDVPFAVIEEPPVFPSCEGLPDNSQRKKCTSEKINQLVNKNFNTGLANELGLTGINRVIVQFRINHKGEIEDIRARAPHPKLEQEAARVVNLIPRMTPGKQRGEIVGVMYSLPIAFKVQDSKTENSNKNPNSSPKKEQKDPESKDLNNNQLRNLLKLEKKKDNN